MLELLRALFPFVREMLLGDKTVKEAFKDSKRRVVFLFLVMASFAINLYIIPRSISISKDYIELNRKYKDLDNSFNSLVNATSQDNVQKAQAIIAQHRQQDGVSNQPAAPIPNNPPKAPDAIPPISVYDRVKEQMNPGNGN